MTDMTNTTTGEPPREPALQDSPEAGRLAGARRAAQSSLSSDGALHRQAAELLDRLPVVPADPAPWRAAAHDESASRGAALLLFRLADEWLALPASVIEEVSPMRAWHTVPGHRQRALLGLVNLRGALVPCVSLGELLGVQPAAQPLATPANTWRTSTSRLLAMRHGAHLSAFPVTEVHGTVTPASSALGTVPATALGASDGFAHAVLHWRERVVGLLDPARVGAAFDRSLG
ncbi:chemotaxis protein CheW [Pandoraea iniqua]|uniref:Chemotaxis protein CheW n=2 Tax=Pandoraea iniqua TaxID=2508288 RepID=A0A5E4RY06_9BURK|nr:chemotaxis protein CheW [Pandoraea iniqua]VVD67324.1 chemotaxis protein CheW [Pandoraea iniqua]